MPCAFGLPVEEPGKARDRAVVVLGSVTVVLKERLWVSHVFSEVRIRWEHMAVLVRLGALKSKLI